MWKICCHWLFHLLKIYRLTSVLVWNAGMDFGILLTRFVSISSNMLMLIVLCLGSVLPFRGDNVVQKYKINKAMLIFGMFPSASVGWRYKNKAILTHPFLHFLNLRMKQFIDWNLVGGEGDGDGRWTSDVSYHGDRIFSHFAAFLASFLADSNMILGRTFTWLIPEVKFQQK